MLAADEKYHRFGSMNILGSTVGLGFETISFRDAGGILRGSRRVCLRGVAFVCGEGGRVTLGLLVDRAAGVAVMAEAIATDQFLDRCSHLIGMP